MASAAEESVAGDQAVQAARVHVVSALLADVDRLTDRGVAAIRAEIPAYAAQDGRFFEDVTDQVRRHYSAILSTFLEARSPTLADIAFVRGGATRRARAGFALEDYLNAYRVGQQVIWEAIVASAGQTAAGRGAALTLASPLMRYIDFASTSAAHSYVEFRQYVVADADRERRDLLEHLLAGELPVRSPLMAAAERYGIGQQTRMLVAVAVPVGGVQGAGEPDAASAALARSGLREATTLVVVRQAEIVALPALGAGEDPGALCDGLEQLQVRLRREGLPLAMGISTVAGGVAELPRAYREAREALGCVTEDGGVTALTQLSPFRYLGLRADDTARRLVDQRTRAFLDDDRRRGGVLTATIRVFADADLNMRVAAERLHIHPNTALYRLGRVEELTGRNPRLFADLLDLIVAIAIDDTESVSQ